MREILFRGKVRGNYDGYESIVKDNGWLYGDLHQIGHAIYIDGFKWRLRVEPNTVGQFTGLLDKNGRKIFDGDILSLKDEAGKRGKVVVGYENGSYIVFKGLAFRNIGFYDVEDNYIEIIGNIHDNKDKENE